MRLTISTRSLALREPLRAAWGELRARELLVVRLEDPSDGAVGFGEAAPLQGYDGVSLARARAALERYATALADAAELNGGHREGGSGRGGDPAAVAACRRVDDLPQALAAVDLAWWDLCGRQAGRSVGALLAADDAPLPRRVPVNGLVGATAPRAAAEAAAALVAAGHRCVKVKVGLDGDVERVAAVRAAVGPGVRVRIDANGAWATVERALAALQTLAPHAIELCEEPVHGVEPQRALRAASPVPIASDETLAPGSGATDFACLKIAACGGIGGVLEAAAAARAAGTVPYLASTFDGPLGIAAALHAAAALRIDTACGLATLGAFAEHAPPPIVDGTLAVPDRPGL